MGICCTSAKKYTSKNEMFNFPYDINSSNVINISPQQENSKENRLISLSANRLANNLNLNPLIHLKIKKNSLVDKIEKFSDKYSFDFISLEEFWNEMIYCGFDLNKSDWVIWLVSNEKLFEGKNINNKTITSEISISVGVNNNLNESKINDDKKNLKKGEGKNDKGKQGKFDKQIKKNNAKEKLEKNESNEVIFDLCEEENLNLDLKSYYSALKRFKQINYSLSIIQRDYERNMLKKFININRIVLHLEKLDSYSFEACIIDYNKQFSVYNIFNLESNYNQSINDNYSICFPNYNNNLSNNNSNMKINKESSNGNKIIGRKYFSFLGFDYASNTLDIIAYHKLKNNIKYSNNKNNINNCNSDCIKINNVFSVLSLLNRCHEFSEPPYLLLNMETFDWISSNSLIFITFFDFNSGLQKENYKTLPITDKNNFVCYSNSTPFFNKKLRETEVIKIASNEEFEMENNVFKISKAVKLNSNLILMVGDHFGMKDFIELFSEIISRILQLDPICFYGFYSLRNKLVLKLLEHDTKIIYSERNKNKNDKLILNRNSLETRCVINPNILSNKIGINNTFLENDYQYDNNGLAKTKNNNFNHCNEEEKSNIANYDIENNRSNHNGDNNNYNFNMKELSEIQFNQKEIIFTKEIYREFLKEIKFKNSKHN